MTEKFRNVTITAFKFLRFQNEHFREVRFLDKIALCACAIESLEEGTTLLTQFQKNGKFMLGIKRPYHRWRRLEDLRYLPGN